MEIKGNYQVSVGELAASIGVYLESDEMVRGIASSVLEMESGDVLVRENIELEACEAAYQKGIKAIVCQNEIEFDKLPVMVVKDVESARGILANALYQEPSSHLNIIAVTGTNGKTTVSYLCAQAMQYLSSESMYLGTLGYGRVGNLKPQLNTTPSCGQLHQKLAEARDKEIETVALEASSIGIDQGRLSGVMIDVAVFTNLTHEHLDYHKTINAYLAAKQKLLMMKSVAATVINQDDPSGAELVKRIKKPLWPVSFENMPRGFERWTYGIIDSMDLSGMKLKLLTHQGACVIETKLIGAFNAENLAMAHAAMSLLGIDIQKAAKALSSIDYIPGRMQRVHYAELMSQVIIDYSHTPHALERVLQQLRALAKGRIWVVFGCGGNRDQEKRPLMGSIAERYADEVIITEDNSRDEKFEDISKMILSGMKLPGFSHVIPSRYQAIKYALRESLQNDIVLIAGKGHETTMVSEEGVQDFSDIVAVESILIE